jgi:cell division protein FtsB
MDVTTAVRPGMDIWTEYGFAGLFVFVFLVIFFYLLWELRRSKQETLALSQQCTDCITRDNELKRELVSVTKALQMTIEQNSQQNRDFLTYMRARDDFFKRS